MSKKKTSDHGPCLTFYAIILFSMVCQYGQAQDGQQEVTKKDRIALMDVLSEIEKMGVFISYNSTFSAERISKAEKTSLLLAAATVRPPVLVIAGRVEKILVDAPRSKEGLGNMYVLVKTRSTYGNNDLMTKPMSGGLSTHRIEHWNVRVDDDAPGGQAVLLFDRTDLLQNAADLIGQSFFFMVRPNLNIWLEKYRETFSDGDMTQLEKEEYLEKAQEKQFANAASFDARIPWAVVEKKDLVKEGGLKFYSDVLRYELSLLKADKEVNERYAKLLRDLGKQDDSNDKIYSIAQQGPWNAAFAASTKLCERGDKRGLQKLVDMIAFDAWIINARQRIEKADFPKADKRICELPAGELAILVAVLEKYTGQEIKNTDAFLQWYESSKEKLHWDKTSNTFVP